MCVWARLQIGVAPVLQSGRNLVSWGHQNIIAQRYPTWNMHYPHFYTASPDGWAGCDGKDMKGEQTCSLFFKRQCFHWIEVGILVQLSICLFVFLYWKQLQNRIGSIGTFKPKWRLQPDPLTLRLVFRRWPPLLFRQQPPAQQKIPITSCLIHIVMCMRMIGSWTSLLVSSTN